MPWETAETKQFFVALWQPCPLFVNALHFLFTKLDAFASEHVFDDPEPSKKTTADSTLEMGFLLLIYSSAFAVSATVHLVIMATCLTSTDPQLSLHHVFVAQQARGHHGLTEALHFIFQIDWWIIFGASMVWCVQAIWDLKSMGKARLGPLKGLVTVMLSAVVLGPGATLSLVWWWREWKLLVVKPKET